MASSYELRSDRSRVLAGASSPAQTPPRLRTCCLASPTKQRQQWRMEQHPSAVVHRAHIVDGGDAASRKNALARWDHLINLHSPIFTCPGSSSKIPRVVQTRTSQFVSKGGSFSRKCSTRQIEYASLGDCTGGDHQRRYSSTASIRAHRGTPTDLMRKLDLTLQVAFTIEFVALSEFLGIVLPLFYVIHGSLLVKLPDRVFHTELA
jgi:hypothetical protein